jgi:PAS domain S-box-containing protein
MHGADGFPGDAAAPPIGENAARLAAERIAFAADALPALIAYVDTAGRYLWVNLGYGRWFQRPTEEIVGRHASEILGAEAMGILGPYIDRALAGEQVTFEHTAVRREGVLRHLQTSYVPDLDGNGLVRGFVVLVIDITEAKMETALRQSERMLEQAQTIAQLGSWQVMLDENGAEVPGTLIWSSETYRIFGIDPHTSVDSGEDFYRNVHPDDRRALAARAAYATEHVEPFEQEYRIMRPDGSMRFIHARFQFERQADGKMMRAFGTCQDITERKQAELEIRHAREQLQLVVDSTPAFIARYNRAQRLVWANKGYAARFGKTPEELVGSRLIDLVGEAVWRLMEPFCARVLSGETVLTELAIPYLTGSRFVHLSASPTFDPAGVPDGCVTVLTDVTHWRQLEQERERALNELREADRRKDEFLAMLSHELRNPLAPILNSVEVLEHLGPRREELAGTFTKIIARQARHMKRLLDDLLDVSRVSQGKIELQTERVDLGRLLLEAVEVSRPMIAEKQQELSLMLAPQAVVLEADPTRLVQVFSNLINNAVKYTNPGGHIAILSAVENGEAVITVRDDGTGMTPDLLASAFDLFVQGTRALDRAQGGLGIGLTLVRTLVKMHGGSVRAFSEGPGRGCELVVRLPLALAEEASRSGLGTAERDGKNAPLRVLVVEDNADTAAVLAQLLRLVGHQVTIAHDGPGALAAAAAAPPDLVFLDIGVPGMDGYAIAAQLRATGHTRAALVALTGYGRDDSLRRSREAGFDHHLVKPADLAQLERIIALVRARGASG